METREPDVDLVRVVWTPTHGDVMTTCQIVSSRHAAALGASQYQFWTLSSLAAASILAGFVAVAFHLVNMSTGVVVLCVLVHYSTWFLEDKLFWNAVWRRDRADAKPYMDVPRTIEIGRHPRGRRRGSATPWTSIVELTEGRGMLLFWVGVIRSSSPSARSRPASWSVCTRLHGDRRRARRDGRQMNRGETL